MAPNTAWWFMISWRYFLRKIPHILNPPVAGFVPEADPSLQFCGVRVDEGRTFDKPGEVASVPLVAFHLFPRIKHVFQVHLENHVIVELARGEAASPPNNIPRTDANANLVPKAHSLEFERPKVLVVHHRYLEVCTIYRCGTFITYIIVKPILP